MLVERHLPTDLRYKGNRRKRSLRVSSRHAEGRSLDSFKQLATSEKNRPQPQTYSEWLKSQKDARDRQRRAYWLQDGLLDTLKPLVYAEGEERAAAWRKSQQEHEAEFDRVDEEYAIQLVDGGNIHWGRTVFAPDTSGRPTPGRKRVRRWSPAKEFQRLSGCQSEWIGFKAKCCTSRAVAVPIGCNSRVCALCNSHRADHFRKRVQALFHELSNPQLLTLTVPSPRIMTREVVDTLRKRLKAFLKQEKALLLGGVYSIEITYNRRDKLWHPHVHVLVDINDPREEIPYAEWIERKWTLEFKWFLLTQGKRQGKRKWKRTDFVEWCGGRNRNGRLRGPGPGDHRRTVDLRPVTKDRKAAYEVMKYMAKAVTFIGEPVALRQLMVAVRGVRQIQTFGTCYNFSLEEEMVFDERKGKYRKARIDERKETHLRCNCGANKFERIGVLGLGMVKLSPDGTWYVRDEAPVHGRHCRDYLHKRRR